MRIPVLILICCFCFGAANAQVSLFFANEFNESQKSQIGIMGDYDINSNAITNAFTQKFSRGGYIDEELKKSVLKKLHSSNRIGGNVNYGIYGSFKLDPNGKHKHTSLFFSVRDRTHFDAQFSKDLFRIGFYGNAAHAGQTANLGNFGLNNIVYQQLQFGVFSSKIDSAARWGVGVSFLSGERYFAARASRAELYTALDGQYVNLNTNLSAFQSDTANDGILATNGLGASLELFFEAPFSTPVGKSIITASVADLGAIRFNEKTLMVEHDTMFNYQGFQIASLKDLKDSTLGTTLKDSISNIIVPFKKQAYSVTLPATFHLSLSTQFKHYFHLTEGIRYVFNANNKLLAYLTASFFIKQNYMLATTFAYGGYGTFNYGISTSIKLPKKFIVRAGSNNIEGFILPEKTTGQSAYFSLVKQF